MENDMKLITLGEKAKELVLKECVMEMRKIFNKVYEKSDQMKAFL